MRTAALQFPLTTQFEKCCCRSRTSPRTFSFAFEFPTEVRANGIQSSDVMQFFPTDASHRQDRAPFDKLRGSRSKKQPTLEHVLARKSPHSYSQNTVNLVNMQSAHRARREWRAIVFKSCASKKSTQATLSASSHYSTIPSPKRLLWAFK